MASTARIDFCSREAAKYAVERWHYSHALPGGKLTTFGVWEGGEYVGAIIYGRGANHHIGSEFNLPQTEVCELVRVALRAHTTEVSRLIRITLRLLKKHAPGIRLVISYADPEKGHHGGVYQGAGWVYIGTSSPQPTALYRGEPMHKRSASARFGSIEGLSMGEPQVKHKYAVQLDALKDPISRPLAARLLEMMKPYPKRATA